jgi:hypothetical protein
MVKDMNRKIYELFNKANVNNNIYYFIFEVFIVLTVKSSTSLSQNDAINEDYKELTVSA